MPVSRWYQVGPWRLHARVWSNSGAPPLILLHGLGVSGRYLEPTAERLTEEFDVLVPDLPGFGRSAAPAEVLDVPQLADALAAWMDAAEIPRASLLANSLGCQVAVECAVRHRDRLDQLILVGPTMDPAARTALKQIARLALAALREPFSVWPLVLRDYLTCGLGRAWQTLRYGLRHRLEDRLPGVEVPVLVVRGEHDPICPQEWVARVADLLPQGRLAVIAGAGHIPNYSCPKELAGVAREFLGGVVVSPQG